MTECDQDTKLRRYQMASIVCGGLSGVCSTIVTNPLDTLRTSLAASRGASGVGEKRIWCHVRAMFANGALNGFRTGMAANLLASIPSNAIYLSSYRLVKDEYTARYGFHAQITPVVAAFCAVFCTNVTLAPFFTLRTRCQLDGAHTLAQTARLMWRHDGVRGFYRGALVNTLGRMVEEILFWFTFENLRHYTAEGTFHDRSILWATFTVLGLSSVSKLLGSCIAYPYNVVMTHLREVNKVTGKHDHTRVGQTIRHVYRADGIAGFYKGLPPQLLRSVISKSVQMLVFESTMHWYCLATNTHRV